MRVPVTTLCPCSKEISEYGAHNQRGYVEITRARSTRESDLAFEDLIAVAEASGSAPIYPLLKRVDERHVTMQAYDEPTFVEDVVRRATLALADDERILRFTVAGREPGEHPRPSAVATVHWERRMSDHDPGYHHLHKSQGARRRPSSAMLRCRASAAPVTRARERLYAGEQHRRLMAGVDALRDQRSRSICG